MFRKAAPNPKAANIQFADSNPVNMLTINEEDMKSDSVIIPLYDRSKYREKAKPNVISFIFLTAVQKSSFYDTNTNPLKKQIIPKANPCNVKANTGYSLGCIKIASSTIGKANTGMRPKGLLITLFINL